MTFETIFSMVGLLSMSGWVVLLVSPLIPVWSDRIAGVLVPALLAGIYVAVAVTMPVDDGGFGTFEEVSTLFTQPAAVLAGWIHFLAFDLFVGAWACRTARQEGLPFWAVLPCLPIVFLFGPAGFLLFSLVRGGHWWFTRSRRADR